MAKKAKIARRAKRAEDLSIEQTDVVAIRDARSTWLRILDHITEKGIYAIILFVPLAFLPDTHWLFDLTRVGVLRMLTLMVLLAYLCGIAISKEWRIVKLPSLVLWPILVYLAAYAISTIWSIAPNLSLHSGEGRNFGLISLVNMIVLYFLVINVMTDRRQLMRCLTLLIVSGTAVALLGFYQFYGYHNSQGYGSGIKESHLQILLGVAICFAIAFFYLAVFYRRAGAVKRVWCAVVFAISLVLAFSLAFDLSQDTNAFDAPINAEGVEQPQDTSILYAQVYEDGEPTGIYTTNDYTWGQCSSDGASVARFDGVHQLAPMMAHRASSTFGNPDFLISFLFLIIPIAIAFVLRKKWLYLVPLFLLVVCFVMSLPYNEFGDYRVISIIILLPILVFIFVYHVASEFRVQRPFLFFGICLVIVSILAGGVIGSNVLDSRDKARDFAESHIGLGEDDDRTYLRDIAGRTLDSSKNWIIGSGPNTFRDTFTQHVTLEYSQQKPDRREDKVHNAFVESLVTTGLMGIGTYVVMLVCLVSHFILWLFRSGSKRRFVYIAMILVAVVVYIAQSLSIFHTVVPYTFFWIILAIGVGLTVVDDSPVRKNNLNISKLFSYGLVCILVVASVFGGYLVARPVVADHYSQKGLRAGNCGDIDAEVKWHKKAQEWNGYEIHYKLDYAYALLKQAAKAQQAGDMDTVEQNCTKVLETMTDAKNQEPDSAMVYFNRAQMMSGCGYSLDAVLQDVKQSIDLYPNGYLSYWFAAELFTEAGDLESAIIFDGFAFDIVPKYIGIMQSSLSQYIEALARFGSNYMALGAQYEENGDLEAAQEQYDKAILPHWYIAELLTAVGDVETAVLYDTVAFDIFPEFIPDKMEISMSEYVEALARFGRNLITLGMHYEGEGDLEVSQKQYDNAVAVLGQAVGLESGDPVITFFLGRAYEESGYMEAASAKYEEAVTLLQEAIESEPNDDELHYLLGAAYESLGELDKAEEEYKTALEINPDLQEAAMGLERILGKRTDGA